jgi:hypothetical protein
LDIKKNEISRACGWCGGQKRCIQGYGPRCAWENNIRMDLQEVKLGGMDWIDLAQDRDRGWVLVNAVINVWVPRNVKNLLISLGSVNFSQELCST